MGYEDIKIYCVHCTEHILNTSDKFQCGGPYNGAMFARVHDNNFGAHFSFDESVTGGNLNCPHCENNFIREDEVLLTEYGLVKTGQTTMDRSTTLARDIGSEKNILSRDDVWVPEVKEPEPIVITIPGDEPELLSLPPEMPIRIEITEVPLSPEPESKRKMHFTCKKCGKEIPYGMAHKNGCE